VYKNNVEGKFSKNIRLNNLPDGIYYLRINYNNNNLIFKKIIIQK
ncbi:MAG: T9SS type A sorting domain-containing protein, partial [Bacteroidales bacterium]|nr:T9SS type A sorting domain-containing protein [Bacteroidales bacterium]